MTQTPNPPTHLAAVGLIIPALDEALGLAELLPRLRRFPLGQIIVADNGSTDATARVARDHGATVVTEPKRGYGAACRAALDALHDDVEIVAFMDADCSDDPQALPALIQPLRARRADLVLGFRAPHLRQPNSLTPQQRFGNRLATGLIRLGWRKRYRDLGPFRAIRRDALARLNLRDRAYGWTVEMQVRAVECGLRILEIPVPYRPRLGRSKISGTLRGTILAGYWILRTIGGLWLTKRRRLPSHASPEP